MKSSIKRIRYFVENSNQPYMHSFYLAFGVRQVAYESAWADSRSDLLNKKKDSDPTMIMISCPPMWILRYGQREPLDNGNP